MTELLNDVYREGELLSVAKHTLRMEIASTVNLPGNRDELRSAFSNLFSNAIRYTPQGGEILLRWFQRDGQPCSRFRTAASVSPHSIYLD